MDFKWQHLKNDSFQQNLQPMTPKKVAISWSGGKDSAMMLHALKQQKDVEVVGLFSTFNQESQRINLHEVHINLLEKQAKAANLLFWRIPLPPKAKNEVYEGAHLALFQQLQSRYGIEAIAFGDIFLTPIRDYRLVLMEKAGLVATFPLWGQNTKTLLHDFKNLGMKAVFTAVDALKLSEAYLGEELTTAIAAKGIDPCGENGEYHTFVYHSPDFKAPIDYKVGKGFAEDYRPEIELKMHFRPIFPSKP